MAETSTRCEAVPWRTHLGLVAPTETGKSTLALNLVTEEKFGFVDSSEKIIWVTESEEEEGKPDDLRVIRNIPNWEEKYEIITLTPDEWTEEEHEEFAEQWTGKNEASEIAMMAWKLREVYYDLAKRPKTDLSNVMVLEDLSAMLRKKEFKFVEDRLTKMRKMKHEHTYLM
jgi:hypothetical protein